jgi:hypothetical protein
MKFVKSPALPGFLFLQTPRSPSCARLAPVFLPALSRKTGLCFLRLRYREIDANACPTVLFKLQLLRRGNVGEQRRVTLLRRAKKNALA